ncbi:hypothetical protein IGI37_002631 [Enterococcus sp. AZ194]|uniref:AAA family ATPase n=1 Tax=Enterococcus sp. AZ194 TaxID=2774629 RepID=UPI003F27EC70
MKKYLILIAGSPATGKSYLINQIRTVLPNVFIVTPDELKETLADSVGFDSLEEKQELERDVWKYYYELLELNLIIGRQHILSEYPFSDKQKHKLAQLAEKYDYQVITIRLVAAFDNLWKRRRLRDIEENRHLSHIMSHYHYGDELHNREQADNLITEQAFKDIIEARQYANFSLGTVIEYDVTDFSKVDYTSLLDKLKKLN